MDHRVIWKGKHISGCREFAVLLKKRIAFVLKPKHFDENKCAKCGEESAVIDRTIPLCDKHYAKQSANRIEVATKLWERHLKKHV